MRNQWKVLLLVFVILCSSGISEAKIPLKVRDKDSQVVEVEQMLSKLGYEIRWIDDEFGYETLRAVKEFQAKEKLPQTGVVDKRTWERLKKTAKQQDKKVDSFGDFDELKVKDKDIRVKEAEVQLVKLGYNIKWVDDEFGYETERAVKSFQKERKLPETGMIDKDTWEAIWGRGGAVPLGTPAPNTTPTGRTRAITSEARKYIGVPYVWGGATPSGFDCSGYVQYVFNKYGQALPRTADLQYLKGSYISKFGLRQGDLVFFETYEPGPSHNGIYLGQGQFIHASSSRGVMISNLEEDYWVTRYVGARRILK